MKRKILKIAAFCVAAVLIGGIGFFANGLVGNPVSRMLAERTAREHLAENYEGIDFVVERVSFSFKDTSYHAYITLPGSIDSDFSLTIAMNGRLLLDTYETRVLQGWNTANRISAEYRSAVERVVDNPAFPYDCHIAYGEIAFTPGAYAHDESTAEYAIVIEELELDGYFDIREMGAEAGHLVIYVYDDTVTVERLSEIILGIKEMMDKSGVAFYAMDCVLEYPGSEEDGMQKEGRVEVRDFLCSDIYEEGMADRVREANQAAISYYDEMDAEK